MKTHVLKEEEERKSDIYDEETNIWEMIEWNAEI